MADVQNKKTWKIFLTGFYELIENAAIKDDIEQVIEFYNAMIAILEEGGNIDNRFTAELLKGYKPLKSDNNTGCIIEVISRYSVRYLIHFPDKYGYFSLRTLLEVEEMLAEYSQGVIEFLR